MKKKQQAEGEARIPMRHRPTTPVNMNNYIARVSYSRGLFEVLRRLFKLGFEILKYVLRWNFAFFKNHFLAPHSYKKIKKKSI